MRKRTSTLSTPLMSVAQAADFLRVGARTILNEIARGNLPAFRIGRLWRVKESDLFAYLRARYMRSSSKRVNSSDLR
jgi:excisionase family DNA binding protein